MRKPIARTLLDTPAPFWVLSGFLVAFFGFFILPIFGNDEQVMKFPQYVPSFDQIGGDLSTYLGYSKSRIVDGVYVGNYTPFANLFFSPLLFVSFETAFRVISFSTLLAYGTSVLYLPYKFSSGRQGWEIVFLLLSGLFSYGLHFELERGQFDVIAMAISLAAIYFFHHKTKNRLLAYVLFSLSTQLKLWPAIFALLLVDNWADWRANLKRFIGLAIFNFALLFVLGTRTFLDFLEGLEGTLRFPYIWIGNHSIAAFADQFSGIFITGANSTSILQWLLFVLVLMSLFAIIIKALVQREKGFNPALLLASTVAACLIPSVSHDYKLSILAGPMAIALMNIQLPEVNSRRFFALLLISATSFAYSLTLFSYTNKPGLWKSNFMPLLGLLLAVTFLDLFGFGTKQRLAEKLHQAA